MKKILSRIIWLITLALFIATICIFPVFIAVRYSLGIGIFTMFAAWTTMVTCGKLFKDLKEIKKTSQQNAVDNCNFNAMDSCNFSELKALIKGKQKHAKTKTTAQA